MKEHIFVISYYLTSRYDDDLTFLVAIGKQELNDALVSILKEAYECGNFFPEPEDIKAPDFTEEDITGFPESIQDKCKAELDEYNQLAKSNKANIRLRDKVRKFLRKNDGGRAYNLINSMTKRGRRNHIKVVGKKESNSFKTSPLDPWFVLWHWKEENKSKGK